MTIQTKFNVGDFVLANEVPHKIRKIIITVLERAEITYEVYYGVNDLVFDESELTKLEVKE